tara:strand:- start:3 stop:170 length:168 start_codon:yes stop_codon:yes gene_type:complete
MPKKSVKVKQVSDHNKIQINIKKNLDDEKKIRPEKVFDGYTKKTNKKTKKNKSKY